jgi:hypothetical protein
VTLKIYVTAPKMTRESTLRTIIMPTRLEARHLVRLKVELAGTDRSGYPFKQTVFTYDISMRGAHLLHVPPLLQHASLVMVRYRGKKGRFRVAWLSYGSGEIGLQNLEPNKCIWGKPLPGHRVIHVAATGPVA